MSVSSARQSAPVVLVCGDDEFGVKQRSRAIYQTWVRELGGMDHEVIEGSVSNAGEALKAITQLREALQTLPFFGTAKVVWLKNCNFLGDERAASVQAVTDRLGELARELKELTWDNVRLLISAGKVDKRKTFYKTLDKLGSVETIAGWSAEDRDWSDRAEAWARGALRGLGKEITDEALAELVERVGPNARQLHNEVEKLSLYCGDRAEVQLQDVEAICVRNKSARAFALGDALGERDLPGLLARLDEELWEVRLDPQKSEIGLLYGLIAKVRAMLFLKEMLREGWLKPDADYNRFKAQLGKVPPERFPEDRRFSPLALNPYVFYKALPQVRRYTGGELVAAMELLLECNRRLVSSGLDGALVLQQTLVQIVASPAGSPA